MIASGGTWELAPRRRPRYGVETTNLSAEPDLLFERAHAVDQLVGAPMGRRANSPGLLVRAELAL